MRRLAAALLATCLFASSSTVVAMSELTFASWNIRYAPGQDPSSSSLNTTAASPITITSRGHQPPIWGERPWHQRLPPLLDTLTFFSPDVFGLQEVLHHQLVSLTSALSGEYDWVGVGRDDGREEGEAVPVFWKSDRMRLVGKEHFWLSKTPEVPGSKDWDAGQTRMVTLVKLQLLNPPSSPPTPPPSQPKYYDPDIGPDYPSPPSPPSAHRSASPGETFYVLNTHWDDRGLRSRTESAKIILSRVRRLLKEEKGGEVGREPLVVLLGDLNSPAEEEGYRVLTGRRYVDKGAGEGEEKEKEEEGLVQAGGEGKQVPLLANLRSTFAAATLKDETTFLDSRHELLTRSSASASSRGGGGLRLSGPWGEHDTFTGFDRSDKPEVIDFIMYASNAASSALTREGEEGKGGWEVVKYGVVPNRFEGGFFVSDHRMVFATLRKG